MQNPGRKTGNVALVSTQVNKRNHEYLCFRAFHEKRTITSVLNEIIKIYQKEHKHEGKNKTISRWA